MTRWHDDMAAEPMTGADWLREIASAWPRRHDSTYHHDWLRTVVREARRCRRETQSLDALSARLDMIL